MRKTILCLANSYKHGGRCVAGVCGDDGVWIRLRGAAVDGSLDASESVLDDGSEPRLLDVIEVELHYALPSDAHPEDWQIAPVRWRLLQRPASADMRSRAPRRIVVDLSAAAVTFCSCAAEAGRWSRRQPTGAICQSSGWASEGSA